MRNCRKYCKHSPEIGDLILSNGLSYNVLEYKKLINPRAIVNVRGSIKEEDALPGDYLLDIGIYVPADVYEIVKDILPGEEIVDPYNGHAYVDLGLPSGTKWATMNVGANSETDYGLYFAWGETQGYADASTKAFSWSDYKWSDNGSSSVMTKYNATDGKTALDPEDDAAHANWGGDWHMPTEAQCQELFNTANCTNTWTTVNGVNGRLFTSVSNGNTLFIPAAGDCYSGSVDDVGDYGNVWASSLSSSNVDHVWYFYFGSGGGVVYKDYRYYGYSVRGVVG